ncbi:MFS transporter, partial [Escherichia coli]|uniref:MFS transporter n=1 Tax=Escherichia coli TaxID=562 RepID=UPI0021D4C343
GMDESLSESSIEAARVGKAQKSGSMYELFVHQWRPLLLCFLITAGGTVAFYTYSVNGPKMIQSAFAGNDPMTGTLINLGVLAFRMVLQPVGGWLSDIIGRKTLLVFFGVGGVLYSWYLITQLPHQHDATLAFLTLALAFVI